MRSSNGRILLVADEAGSRDAVADDLERAGFDVSCARSAGAALALTAVDAPDLVLLDAGTLESAGADLLSRMRAHQRMKNVPIFVVLPPNLEADVEAGLRRGADACLPRQVDPRVLRARITMALRTRSRVQRARLRRSLPPRASGAPPRLSSLPPRRSSLPPAA